MKFRGIDGRLLGEINMETSVFIKEVHGRKDRVKTPAGWAIEAGTVNFLFTIGCVEIRIYDKSNGKTYTIPFETFTQNGTVIDSEYGQKILVEDKFWVLLNT